MISSVLKHHSFDEISLSTIRLIDFEKFKAFGGFPRYPDNKDITIVLNEFIESNLYDDSLIVFVSHRWLRSWDGAEGWDVRAHPDDAKGSKFQLCIDGIERLKSSQASEMKYCYLWIDYSCIDQDNNAMGELKLLDKITQICDIIFTPIYDPHPESLKLSSSYFNHFERYAMTGWIGTDHSYVNRGWCRIEMFYAANIPLLLSIPTSNDDAINHECSRVNKFQNGLAFHCKEGRRPHMMYSSYHVYQRIEPAMLTPLQNSWFDEYNPVNGHLSTESDREIIRGLVEPLKPFMKTVNLKHGQGKYIHATGDFYEGEYKNNQMNGIGKYIYANGNTYEGEFKDDKWNGHGKLSFHHGDIYEGEFRDGLKHGLGKHIFSSGDIYVGEGRNNLIHGQGKYFHADGCSYEGEFSDNIRHGHGRYVNADGDIYEGEYKNNKKSIGKYSHANGDIYEGGFKDDKRNGHGKVSFSHGDIYEGEFEDGRMCGYGICTFANGDIYEGELKDDKWNGHGKLSFHHGDIYEGEFKDDKWNGHGKLSFYHGDIYEGEFRDGLKHGVGKHIFASGDIYEGEGRNNLIHGQGKYFHADGDIYEGEYKNNKRSIGTVYANGDIDEVEFKDDMEWLW